MSKICPEPSLPSVHPQVSINGHADVLVVEHIPKLHHPVTLGRELAPSARFPRILLDGLVFSSAHLEARGLEPLPDGLAHFNLLTRQNHRAFAHQLLCHRLQHRFLNPLHLRYSRSIVHFRHAFYLPYPCKSRKVAPSRTRPGTFTAEDLARYRAAWSQPGAMTATINWYRACVRVRLAIPDPRVQTPTRILWGKRDMFLLPSLAEDSMKYCDSAELSYFPDATHWVQHQGRKE